VESALNGLHFLYLAVLLGIFCAGWGARIVRLLLLPVSFVLPAGFALFACGAYGVFYAYFAAPLVGQIVAITWGVVSFTMFVCEWRTAEGRGIFADREAWLPGVWLVLLTLCWLAVLGAYVLGPSQRFTWDLPNDNEIPKIFADKLMAGVSPTPISGEWLSSDRPPLQSGLELSLRPWHVRDQPAVNYHFDAILMQMTWLPALFALGRVLRFDHSTLRIMVLVCATSGFFLLNSLYVWPKLLAASLFITALGVMLVSVRDRSAGAGHAIFATGCATLGLLAHGGVAFSVLALPALPATWVFARRVSWRGIVGALVVFLLLYTPWRAYQKFYDPPGDRLWKWHLAGVIPVDQRSFPQILREQYGQLTLATWLHGKQANLMALVLPKDNPPLGPFSAGYVREAQFFHQVPALDVLNVGLLALLLVRRRAAGATAPLFLRQLLWYALSSLAIWVLLMFIPGSCIVHQGSYATTALLFLLGAAGLASCPAILRWPLLAAHVGIFVWVWLATTPPTPGSLFLLPVAVVGVVFWLCFVVSLGLLPAENIMNAPGRNAMCSDDAV
jgi:hypothetical protein